MKQILLMIAVVALVGCQSTPSRPPFISNLKDFQQDGVSVQFQRSDTTVNSAYGLGIRVSGIITNTNSESLKLVQLWLDLIDGDGVKLTSGGEGTHNLKAGQSWRFSIIIHTSARGTYPPTLELQKLAIWQ